MKSHHRLGIWLAALLMLCGCAGPWQKAPAVVSAPRWTAAIPGGWMRLAMADYDMFSRDGTHLHYILIQERPLGRSFRFTRNRIDNGMLPHEVAETVLDDLRADPQIRNFKVLRNEPVKVGGIMGFRLIYSYIDPLGVEMRTEYYGALLPGALFNLRYTAARRHYFDKYQAEFDHVYRSLHLKNEP